VPVGEEHQQGRETTIVSQATDYETWGGVLREQKWEDLEGKYRYGYQGKYAEKDEETGWNHFEAREYDPTIGKWITIDPARQFSSPYLAFANNPVKYIDPDGRIVPIAFAVGWLAREASWFAVKRFAVGATMDALAQFAGNVAKDGDYSSAGLEKAFQNIDFGDAVLEGLASIPKLDPTKKYGKIMDVALPVLTELLKSSFDYKPGDNESLDQVRSILGEKGYAPATIDLTVGLVGKLGGALSKALGGGNTAEKFINEKAAPFIADFVGEWVQGAGNDVVEKKQK